MSFRRFLLAFALTNAAVHGLRIGAFNIRALGTTKYGKEEVMTYIDQILRRYDVVLVQEIRDISGVVIPGIRDRLRSNGEQWDVVYSESLGRSTYKEQYAYYYRTDMVTVEPYQYDDGVDDGTDAFAREPFGVLVNSDTTGALIKFGLLGVHITPEEAVAELDALVDVFAAAKLQWEIEDIMVMGDLNADCSYVNGKERANLALKLDRSYLWLIGDEVDTTVSSTDCSYDRMILTGDLLKAAVNVSSAMEFRYDDVYNLDSELARDISDHYPVEVTITPSSLTSTRASSSPNKYASTPKDMTTAGSAAFWSAGLPSLKLICCLLVVSFLI